MQTPASAALPTPGQRLARLRETVPLVHNITNYVAMNTMANVLLAMGASPAMIHAREEAAAFVPVAAALTINIGTLSREWLAAMVEAAVAASAAGRPWVLDPVAAGVSSFRLAAAQRLLSLRPTVLRGNASEIIALGMHGGATGRGVDAADGVAAAAAVARELAVTYGSVVAVTGPVDLLTDGVRCVRVANGHALMPQVTALGCALTGVVAAFLGSDPDPAADALATATAALACYGVAGERAGAVADGPGSFAVAFLDALHGLAPAEVDAEVRIEWVDC
ncbi:MAG: hydroxyethylthiazole kinase [Chromatiaceae bacterium]|nr:MAG: hydroxyethylthiazole kinase [Chromatiaceae bacterium]